MIVGQCGDVQATSGSIEGDGKLSPRGGLWLEARIMVGPADQILNSREVKTVMGGKKKGGLAWQKKKVTRSDWGWHFVNQLGGKSTGSRIKRTQREYSPAFKLSVIEQPEEGEMSYLQAQRRICMRCASIVLKWLRKHGHEDSRGGAYARQGVVMEQPVNILPLTPEQLIRELEEQLKQANQKGPAIRSRRGCPEGGLRGSRKEAFRQVLGQKLVERLSVSGACRYWGISRQVYYRQCQSECHRAAHAEEVIVLVTYTRLREPQLDMRKLHHLLGKPLGERGSRLGRDRQFDILRNAPL
jgi:transposase-like protein